MRTIDEIVTRMTANASHDIFGFQAEVLAPFLPADRVRAFCRPDADLSDWTAADRDRETILAAMRDYMQFAWTKCEDHRGISADRSVQKLTEWCWLLGDDDAVAFASQSAHYAQYGAPVLLFLSQRYGFDVPESDNLKRMSQGLPCNANYDCGCGR